MKIKKIVLSDNTEIVGKNMQINTSSDDDNIPMKSNERTRKKTRSSTKELLSDMVNPRSNVSSKRITAIFLILVAVSTYILDAMQILIVNAEICIWLISGGIVLLTSTAIEKFSPSNFKLFDQYSQMDEPPIMDDINEREPTEE